MILSDTRILEEMEKGTIKIVPYKRDCLGSNSYDVHLGATLATYKEHILDAKKHNTIETFEIPDEGFVLYSTFVECFQFDRRTGTVGLGSSFHQPLIMLSV